MDPLMLDSEPIVVQVPSAVQFPPGDVTQAEWQQLRQEVQDATVVTVGDLQDVDMTGIADGQVLVYDLDTETFEPGNVGVPLQMQYGGIAGRFGPVEVIDTRYGIQVTQSEGFPHIAIVEPIYGTGANTIAEGNHGHAIRVNPSFPFPASGSFSSGTRTLVGGNVTGLDPSRVYILKGTLDVQLRGDGTGAGRTRPRMTINGVAVDIQEPPRSVAGVQPQYTVRHPGVQVTGVSSVAVSASIAYVDGDPTWVGGGVLTIEVIANR